MCVCLAYTSEDFHMKTLRHTEDSTPSEDPKTGPRKTLAKNAENVMFYHLRGVRAPRTSMDFQPYLIYEDIRVLGSISKASRGVCAFVKRVNRGYTYTQYTSTGDAPAIGDIPSSQKNLLNLSKGDVLPPLETVRIHY